VRVTIIRGLRKTSAVLLVVLLWTSTPSGQTAWQAEWERVQAGARKEGKLVLAIPLNPDLRTTLNAVLRARFGIEPEFLVGQSTVYARRLADEYQAGVRYFDVIIAGVENLLDRLLPMGAIEALEPQWILPKIKKPKNWWGGHLYADKANDLSTCLSLILRAAFGITPIWLKQRRSNPTMTSSIPSGRVE